MVGWLHLWLRKNLTSCPGLVDHYKPERYGCTDEDKNVADMVEGVTLVTGQSKLLTLPVGVHQGLQFRIAKEWCELYEQNSKPRRGGTSIMNGSFRPGA